MPIKNYTAIQTNNENLFKVVDLNGDWTHYYHKELGYLPSATRVISIGFPKGEGLLRWMKSMSAEEGEKAMKQAGKRGSKVHSAIADLISGQEINLSNKYENEKRQLEALTADEWNYILSWYKWQEDFSPHLISHETAIYSDTHRFAGTLDFVGGLILRKGQKISINEKVETIKEDKKITVLLDWKTSSGIWDDYKLQVAAYAACLLKKPMYTGIVRIGTKRTCGYEMKLWDKKMTAYYFKRFLSARENYDMITGEDKHWSPFIKEIPTSLQIKLPIIANDSKNK